MNKRGINPIIASVLLITFTVVLAAVIINWSGAFFNKISSGAEEKSSKFLVCTNDLSFKVNLKCPNFVTIENNGEVDIKKFVLRFFKDDDFLGTGNLDSLNKNQLQKFTIQDMSKFTNKVEFLAIVNADGKDITCSEVSREAFISC